MVSLFLVDLSMLKQLAVVVGEVLAMQLNFERLDQGPERGLS